MSRCGTRSSIRARGQRRGPTPRSARPGTTRPSRGPEPSSLATSSPDTRGSPTTHAGDATLDEAPITRARSLVGLKGYATFRPQTPHGRRRGCLLPPQAAAHPVRPLRMSKHDLPARPVFHHTRDATWAHPTAVMASLAVTRQLQKATGTTITRIVHKLEGAKTRPVAAPYSRSPPLTMTLSFSDSAIWRLRRYCSASGSSVNSRRFPATSERTSRTSAGEA